MPFCGPVISQRPDASVTYSGGGTSAVIVQQIQAQQAPMQPRVIYVQQQIFRENDDTLCVHFNYSTFNLSSLNFFNFM